MKRYCINFLWIVVAFPFYLIIIVACLYSHLLTPMFTSMGGAKPFDWIYKLDTICYELKNKYL